MMNPHAISRTRFRLAAARAVIKEIGMKFITLGWAIIAIFCLAPSPVQAASVSAEAVMTCGASQGRAYFVSGGVVPSDKAGWRSDDITNGHIELVRQGTSYDIQVRDAQGVFSATRNGNANVIALANTSDALVILAVYPAGATEVYQFRPVNREVVWTQVKYSGLVDKASVYRAPCN